ncbi:MAG: hypothetical protein K2K75_06135 [Muribaculaceae bacterium]|nr:hypothetical protein [Muribaculaceae bacterium]
MDILDEFFNSEENQKKYGFEYYKDTYGNGKIIYDGDIDVLMNTAYDVLGFVEVKEGNETNDTRPELNIQFNQDGRLVIKDTGTLIEADVDGIGFEPNFYIRFGVGDNSTTIRFNMVKPELYPDNQSSSYRFPNPTLSAINKFFGRSFPLLIRKWNNLRKESMFDLDQIPNYRAINRVM